MTIISALGRQKQEDQAILSCGVSLRRSRLHETCLKKPKKNIEGSLNEGEACSSVHSEKAVLLCEERMRAGCRRWRTSGGEAIMADWVIGDPGLGQGAPHHADTENQRLEGS